MPNKLVNFDGEDPENGFIVGMDKRPQDKGSHIEKEKSYDKT
jgi:hypothetical protein